MRYDFTQSISDAPHQPKITRIDRCEAIYESFSSLCGISYPLGMSKVSFRANAVDEALW